MTKVVLKKFLHKIFKFFSLTLFYVLPVIILSFNDSGIKFVTSYFDVFKSIKKVDAIVVLGGGQVKNTITRTAAERVRWAYHLYKNKLAPIIILSGGTTEDNKNYKSEAEIMLQYLLHFEIDKKNILIEKKSFNTYTNYKHVSKILQKINAKSIILVTNKPHILRAYLTFINCNCRVIPSSVPFSSFEFGLRNYRLKFLLHEFLGIIWYKIYYGI